MQVQDPELYVSVMMGLELLPILVSRRPGRILGNGKASDTCLAFLVAALISPVALLSGCFLYGSTPVMSALAPFMVSPTTKIYRDRLVYGTSDMAADPPCEQARLVVET